MRQLEISRQVNLTDEAIFLLYHWINKEDFGDTKLNFTEDMQPDMEKNNRIHGIINGIYLDVIGKLEGKKDRIEYYFKERNAEFSTFGSLAVLWGFHKYNNQLLSYEERILAMDEAQKVKLFAEIIHDEEAANTPTEELKNLADLIRFIEASPYDKEAKWEAIKIFNHQEQHYNEVYHILVEVQELISAHRGLISELEQEFFDYWSNYQENNDIIDTINEKLKISWKSNKATVFVPLLFIPYGVTISISEPEQDTKDIIRVNFLINKDFIISDHKIAQEDVINISKLFCDKSKLDILDFVSKKPCYGKEIADELNLSTATISYHVNALLKIGFVNANVISNKVYYSIDKERISVLLDDIKDYFNRL